MSVQEDKQLGHKSSDIHQKMWKPFVNSSMRTFVNNSSSLLHGWNQLWNLPGNPYGKSEHVLRLLRSLSLSFWHSVRTTACLKFCEMANSNLVYISRIIMGGAIWFYDYSLDTNQQSLQWKSLQSPRLLVEFVSHHNDHWTGLAQGHKITCTNWTHVDCMMACGRLTWQPWE